MIDPPRTAPPVTPQTRVTVLTLNTHKGFSLFNRRYVLPELKAAVESVGADVVLLQETQGPPDAEPSADTERPVMAQHDYLASSLWPNVAYGRNAVYAGGHHGNAVLSRFPILRFENRDLSIPGFEARGLLACVLAVPPHAAELQVLCTHLGLRDAERSSQLERIEGFVNAPAGRATPLVLAGDFNDWRVRANGRLAAAGLKECFAESTGRSARTFPALWPLLRLDRIYVRGVHVSEATVLSARPWTHLSDHAALTVTIAL